MTSPGVVFVHAVNPRKTLLTLVRSMTNGDPFVIDLTRVEKTVLV